MREAAYYDIAYIRLENVSPWAKPSGENCTRKL
jgi:hypothetical protein